MPELYLASRNEKKLQELRALLVDLPLEIYSAAAVPGAPDPVESGTTFAANAAIKARSLAKFGRVWALADDSGLEVDALDGRPGVYSARFAGEQASDEENNTLLLQLMGGVPPAGRTGRFHCVVAIAGPEGNLWTCEGVCEGQILETSRGTGGFGYDPLFVPVGYRQTFAELPAREKQRISHRAQALAQARKYLQTVMMGRS